MFPNLRPLRKLRRSLPIRGSLSPSIGLRKRKLNHRTSEVVFRQAIAQTQREAGPVLLLHSHRQNPSLMSTAQTESAPAGGSPVFPAAGPAISPVAVPAAHSTIPVPTRAEWNAAGLSLVIHLLLLLVLAALLIPVQTAQNGTSIDGGIGTDEGDGELVDSVTIGTPDPGKGTDVEKTATTTVDAVPAVEGRCRQLGLRNRGRPFRRGRLARHGGRWIRQRGWLFWHAGPGRHGRVRGRYVGQHERRPAFRPGRRRVGPFSQFARADPEILCLFLQRRDLSDARLASRQADAGDAGQPDEGHQVDQDIAARRRHGADDAIERALKMKPQVVYFLTDGEIPETTRDTAKKYNRDHKTVIHTIAFVTEEGAAMLKGIAKDHKGKYRFVP